MHRIRTATAADVTCLARLKLETFRETFLEGGFAIPYPSDDLAAFERASYAPDQIARELGDPGKSTWIAEADGVPLGYAMVGACKLPHPDARPDEGELQQIYVRRSAQGQGLGAELLEVALAHLAAARPGPVWLGVWSGNARAQAFYRARGFEPVGTYGFPVGAWTDHEFIFRRL